MTGISGSSTHMIKGREEQPRPSTSRRTGWPSSASRKAAEKAKDRALPRRSRDHHHPAVPSTATEATGPIHFEMKLTRLRLRAADRGPGSQKLKEPFNQGRQGTGASRVGQINHVILVGGSTRMPMVQELVEEPHRWQGASTRGVKPRRGRRHRRGPSRRACSRGEVKDVPAPRRHAAVARHRDQGRHLHES